MYEILHNNKSIGSTEQHNIYMLLVTYLQVQGIPVPWIGIDVDGLDIKIRTSLAGARFRARRIN